VSPRRKNSFCSYCGQPFAAEQPWPRQCGSCAHVSYLNPLPVGVAVVPVDGGLLCIRRTIEPAAGLLALPGGFLEVGETWQEGCARELREETGLAIDPAEVRLFAAHSVPRQGLLLLFGLARPHAAAELPAFRANDEASEMVILPGPAELAFPTHTRVAADYFAQFGRGRPAG
jgi:ADP-ribose pyrophosphatase YjhB (NUDIX family)